MTAPLYLDAAAPDMAFVYIQNPTGGVFAGDRLRTSVTVDPGVRVHVTSQSATKLYRMDDGMHAEHELKFELGTGGYLEHVPDALIPQAGSRYRQHAKVELGSGAILITSETIAPGRAASGERFEYALLDLAVEVWREGRELCADRLVLEPPRARPSRAGVLGCADYLVTLLVLAPESDTRALAGAIDDALAPSAGAAGELPNSAGVVARALAADAHAAQRALRRGWAAARLALVGLPPPDRRK
jgi:urease accessory protein